MYCPHCNFRFSGSDVLEDTPDDFICPVCNRNMSDRPMPPITGIQVFGKYMAAILLGFPLGWIGIGFILSVIGIEDYPGVILVGSALLTAYALGNFLGNRLNKIYSVPARWGLLLAVAGIPIGALVMVLA